MKDYTETKYMEHVQFQYLPIKSASEHPLIVRPIFSSRPTSRDVRTGVSSEHVLLPLSSERSTRSVRAASLILVQEYWEVRETWGSLGTYDSTSSPVLCGWWKKSDFNTFEVDLWESSETVEEHSVLILFDPKNLLLPALFKPDLRASLTILILILIYQK